MRYVLAILPILVVLVLMIRWRWGAHRAGAAGLAVGVLVAVAAFGLTPAVFWVSQAKGLLLSVFVLAVMWPALLLYHWIDQNQGISATARVLEQAIPDKGMCLLLLAWSLSGLLEGVAGFGLPIAVVAPMLVALGVPPLRAVAAVAVGHSWAVTFGDMGVILQTLSAVVTIPVPDLVPYAAILLGFACLLCGLFAAAILGQSRHWPKVIALSLVMATVQHGMAARGLVPLSAFAAGLSGLVIYLVATCTWRSFFRQGSSLRRELPGPGVLRGLPVITFGCYGVLTLIMAALSMNSPMQRQLHGIAWKPQFAAVSTSTGFATPDGPGQVFRPFVHPGTLILLVAAGSIGLGCVRQRAWSRAREALLATLRSAGMPSIGILLMVGLSTLMDHCGMSYLLAQGLSNCLGSAYPVVSPFVGMLGAFATGSNNNSNVLFGSLQKNVAALLHVHPPLLLGSQTAGASIGSMRAPAKIVVGCSTVGQTGREGEVLRQTVPLGLAAGLALGALTIVLCRLFAGSE